MLGGGGVVFDLAIQFSWYTDWILTKQNHYLSPIIKIKVMLLVIRLVLLKNCLNRV